jgi:hypothetical protein
MSQKCDKKIYEKGVCVGIIGGGNAEIMEMIVKKLSEDSGQHVDWHYCAGRAVIRTTGDIDKVRLFFRISQLKYLEI